MLFVFCFIKSANHPNSKKFNEDKTQLKAFLAQLNFQLQRNLDHFLREDENIEQKKRSYAIFRLEKNMQGQIKANLSANKINFKSIVQFRYVLNTKFGEVDPMKMGKYELYRLYQINKE